MMVHSCLAVLEFAIRLFRFEIRQFTLQYRRHGNKQWRTQDVWRAGAKCLFQLCGVDHQCAERNTIKVKRAHFVQWRGTLSCLIIMWDNQHDSVHQLCLLLSTKMLTLLTCKPGHLHGGEIMKMKLTTWIVFSFTSLTLLYNECVFFNCQK